MFSCYEFQKLKEYQTEVQEIILGEWDEFGFDDDPKLVRLSVLCEKVLEYQALISEQSGADFCTQETVDLCSEIRETVKSAVYVGLPGAGGADAIFIIY